MSAVWLGLLAGVAFGFVIQRAGATDADEMAAAHLMENARIPRFMLVTVALSAVGLFGLQAAGVAKTLVLPTSLIATGVGAVIFGIGWGISGYCPGTTWAAAGEGRMDAIFALLGGLAGAAIFAELHPVLIPSLYLPTSLGPLTVADWLGQPRAVIVVAAVFLLASGLMGLIWKKTE